RKRFGMQDAVGPRELADVMEQTRGVNDVLFLLGASDLDREGLGVAGNGGGMTARGAVPESKRVQQHGEDPELQGGQLDRPGLELVRVLLRAEPGYCKIIEVHHNGARRAKR